MRVNSNSWYNSLNWLNLYDADVFCQFPVLSRILDVISIPNPTRDSFIITKLEYFTLMERVCESHFKFVVYFS